MTVRQALEFLRQVGGGGHVPTTDKWAWNVQGDVVGIGMSRPLRSDVEGGWYHVTARGTERRTILDSPEYYEHFLELLDGYDRFLDHSQGSRKGEERKVAGFSSQA